MIWLLLFSYVAVAALLLNLNVAVRAPLVVKAGAIVLVSACYVFVWFGLRDMQGWPTEDDMPERFRLQWVLVEEPDKVTGAPGEVFFWVRHLDADDRPDIAPRAYRLPFSEALAEQAEEVLEKLQGGETLNGYITRQPMDPDETPDDAAQSGDRGQQSLAGDEARLRIEFREVPRPSLPAKAVPTG